MSFSQIEEKFYSSEDDDVCCEALNNVYMYSLLNDGQDNLFLNIPIPDIHTNVLMLPPVQSIGEKNVMLWLLLLQHSSKADAIS